MRKRLNCLNLQTESQKEWLYKAVERRRKSYERLAQREYRSALEAQFKQFYTDKVTAKAEYLRHLDKITKDPMVQAYQRVYQQVATEFSVNTYLNFKSHGIRLQTKQTEEEEEELEFLFLNAIKDFVSIALIDIINSVTQTTAGDIRILIKKLQKNPSLSLQQFQTQLQNHYANIARARATLIGRTEIVRASNKGMLLAAASTNVPMRKVWITQRDHRVRPTPDYPRFDHRSADGQTQELHNAFLVTGENLQYPADPDGSPGNTIRCRCFLTFETKRVEEPMAEAV